MLIRCLWEKGLYDARLWLDGVFAYQCTLLLSLFMLDSLKLSYDPQRENLSQMVQQMQEILQKGPGNRTMTRLVQICLDFLNIVSSAPLGHTEREIFSDPVTSVLAAQDPLRTTHNQCNAETNLNALSNVPVAPFFNWETFVAPDWFQGDSMEGNYWFDMSMPDFPTEAIDY